MVGAETVQPAASTQPNRSVFCWGYDSYGRLGLGTCNEDRSVPTLMPSLANVRAEAAACGAGHTVVAVRQPDSPHSVIVSWGKCHFGQLGHGSEDQDVCIPRLIKSLPPIQVSFLAAGASHVVLHSQSALSTFTWGCGHYGALGHGDETSCCMPRRLKSLDGISLCSADGGRAHTVFVGADGCVQACGRNHKLQCGVDIDVGSSLMTLIRVQLPDSDSAPTEPLLCAQVAAGAEHTLLRMRSGELYACGSNQFGQLGLPRADIECATVTHVPVPHPVVAAIAGQEHSLLILQMGSEAGVDPFQATAGRAFGAGRNDYGQLGVDPCVSACVDTKFQEVPGAPLIDICSAAAGTSHSVLCDAKGGIWTCGDNSHGQLGRACKKGLEHKLGYASCGAATIGLRACKVLRVLSGTNHCMALAANLLPTDPGASDDATHSQRREAYCTLLTSEDFVAGAEVMVFSLLKSGTQRDIVILVTNQISAVSQGKLQSLRTKFPTFTGRLVVQVVDPIPNPTAEVHVPGWINAGYTKLHIWSLISYDVLVYVDADALVLTNVDELFAHPDLSAAPDVFPPTKFNAGVLVVHPSQRTFEDMLEKAGTLASHDGGDTGFLNSYFPHWYTLPAAHRLPFAYNAQRTMYWLTHEKQPGYWKSIEPVKILHFSSSPKPWHSPDKKGDLECIWWQYFYESAGVGGLAAVFAELGSSS